MGEGTERRPASLVYSAVLLWPGAGSIEHSPSTFTLEHELLEGRAVSYVSSCLPFLPSRGSGIRFHEVLCSKSRRIRVKVLVWMTIGWCPFALFSEG